MPLSCTPSAGSHGLRSALTRSAPALCALPLGSQWQLRPAISGSPTAALGPIPRVQSQGSDQQSPEPSYCYSPTSPWGQSWDYDAPSPEQATIAPCPKATALPCHPRGCVLAPAAHPTHTHTHTNTAQIPALIPRDLDPSFQEIHKSLHFRHCCPHHRKDTYIPSPRNCSSSTSTQFHSPD